MGDVEAAVVGDDARELLRIRHDIECRGVVRAMARFDAERREAARTTIWNTGCKSWYLDESGLPTAWPWTFDRFREEMSGPRLDDYEMR